uniref:Uncharacterized protein n=1 Tax=Spironucleus salmonicida TaxID=348837 RepID=V6LTY9_9EUKA|eukprot:EST48132.1 Hypothetical protein SS50377_11733 [Spironucleus salmonicida]
MCHFHDILQKQKEITELRQTIINQQNIISTLDTNMNLQSQTFINDENEYKQMIQKLVHRIQNLENKSQLTQQEQQILNENMNLKNQVYVLSKSLGDCKLSQFEQLKIKNLTLESEVKELQKQVQFFQDKNEEQKQYYLVIQNKIREQLKLQKEKNYQQHENRIQEIMSKFAVHRLDEDSNETARLIEEYNKNITNIQKQILDAIKRK